MGYKFSLLVEYLWQIETRSASYSRINNFYHNVEIYIQPEANVSEIWLYTSDW